MESDTSTPLSGNVIDASKDTRGWFLGHFMQVVSTLVNLARPRVRMKS